MSFLATKVNGSKHITPQVLLKLLKQNKTTIFHPDHVPKKKTGQFHALLIQLLAKGIIGFDIPDSNKVGTNKLTGEHIRITLPNAVDSDGLVLPAYMVQNSYKHLSCVQCVSVNSDNNN